VTARVYENAEVAHDLVADGGVTGNLLAAWRASQMTRG
jgi:hypothetical protein